MKKPHLLLLLALGLIVPVTGCFDFSGKLRAERDQLEAECHALKNELRKNSAKLDHRGMLMSQRTQLEAHMALLQQLRQGPPKQ